MSDELAAVRALLERLTRDELLALAKEMEIAGRSRMRKDELVEAVTQGLARRPGPPLPSTPPSPLPRTRPGRTSRDRRAALAQRLAALVDPERVCSLRTIEGFVCSLPPVRGADRCALHGGCDPTDLAIPAFGRLGTDTWPELVRQLMLATYDVDDLGLDPVIAEIGWHVLNVVYYDWFRVDVEGIEHVPAGGPAVVVANHAGAALPWDGMMLQLAVANEMAPVPRRLRVIGTEIFNMVPVLSHLYRKAGAAYAAREDARWVLDHGGLLGVFPEGVRGFQKPIWEAYRLRRFGRGGFVELAMGAGAPIVPVAIVGSEETHPAWFTSRRLAQLVRTFFPEQRVEEIAVWLNPVPLPVHWRIRFLPPIGVGGPTERPDRLTVLETAEQVRAMIQVTLDEMLAARGSIF